MSNGSCPCGGVIFEADLPSKWVAHCHCSMCRRWHGAPYVTWVGMEQERVRVHGAMLRWHASSPGAQRGFCGNCGAMMFFRSDRWPGELHIALAHFGDAIDRAPQVHVFWNDHVEWASIDPNDGLPRKD
jgi:hypothetical protein